MAHDSCIIEDFILPALSSKQFGFLLEWTDEEKGIFRVFWSHKSGRTWVEKYNLVFTTWDKLKGRDSQDEKDYFTNSKGRFRSALNRLKKKVTYLKSSSTKGYRCYQIKLPRDVMKNHMAKEVPIPVSHTPCFPPNPFESFDSEDKNCKIEMESCNSPCSSSASAGSFDSENQNFKIEMEDFNSPSSPLVSAGTYDFENWNCTESFNDCWRLLGEMENLDENQEYDSYVPDMDQYKLDTLHDIVSFDDIQKCEVNLVLEDFEVDDYLDGHENMELRTITASYVKELFG